MDQTRVDSRQQDLCISYPSILNSRLSSWLGLTFCWPIDECSSLFQGMFKNSVSGWQNSSFTVKSNEVLDPYLEEPYLWIPLPHCTSLTTRSHPFRFQWLPEQCHDQFSYSPSYRRIEVRLELEGKAINHLKQLGLGQSAVLARV